VTQVEVRTHVGALGVMGKHEPLVAVCPAGIVRIQQGRRVGALQE
jgi:F0F1-type ATP synthase epsilon subunit